MMNSSTGPYNQLLESTIATTLAMSGQTSAMTAHIGGVPYFVEHMPIFLPFVVFSGLGIVLGILGNGLIVGAILTVKELRTNATCILILNLAFADLVISLFVDTFAIIGKLDFFQISCKNQQLRKLNFSKIKACLSEKLILTRKSCCVRSWEPHA